MLIFLVIHNLEQFSQFAKNDSFRTIFLDKLALSVFWHKFCTSIFGCKRNRYCSQNIHCLLYIIKLYYGYR